MSSRVTPPPARSALARQPCAVCAAVSRRASTSNAATSAVLSVCFGAPASVSPSVYSSRVSPGSSSTVASSACGSSITPSSVPVQASSRGRPAASITTGGGCPPHGATSRKPFARGVARAKIAVRKSPGRLSARTARFRARSTSAGDSCACAAARTVWRASAVSAAASTPLPQTSPIATPWAPSPIAKASKKSPPTSTPLAPASSRPARSSPGTSGSARGSSEACRSRHRVLALVELRAGERDRHLRREGAQQAAFVVVELDRAGEAERQHAERAPVGDQGQRRVGAGPRVGRTGELRVALEQRRLRWR